MPPIAVPGIAARGLISPSPVLATVSPTSSAAGSAASASAAGSAASASAAGSAASASAAGSAASASAAGSAASASAAGSASSVASAAGCAELLADVHPHPASVDATSAIERKTPINFLIESSLQLLSYSFRNISGIIIIITLNHYSLNTLP